MMKESLAAKQPGRRASLLDGARVAAEIKKEVTAAVSQLKQERNVHPSLAAVLVGDDPASRIYVTNKIRACEEVGIRSEPYTLSASTTSNELFALINSLNSRTDVDGILVQLPLPAAINEADIIEALDPDKDVDGFHPISVGNLSLGRPTFVPCTPAGILELLDRNGVPIRGANACIVGRSQIVGRPIAQLLLQRDATITICHSQTRDLPSLTQQADLLIVAIGRPAFIRREHIKPGATVVDVGINRITDENVAQELFGEDAERRIEVIRRRGYTLVGDVHPAEADEVASLRTPVPGGVGLLTVAMLMSNTVKAARKRRRIS